MVLSIIAIGLAVAIPALPRRRAPYQQARREISLVLARSRASSAQTGRVALVALDTTTGTYQRWLRGGPEEGDSLVETGIVGGGEPRAPQRITPLVVVQFDPLGRAEGSLRFRYDLAGQSGVLQIDGWTGEVDPGKP